MAIGAIERICNIYKEQILNDLLMDGEPKDHVEVVKVLKVIPGFSKIYKTAEQLTMENSTWVYNDVFEVLEMCRSFRAHVCASRQPEVMSNRCAAEDAINGLIKILDRPYVINKGFLDAFLEGVCSTSNYTSVSKEYYIVEKHARFIGTSMSLYEKLLEYYKSSVVYIDNYLPEVKHQQYLEHKSNNTDSSVLGDQVELDPTKMRSTNLFG